MTALVLCQIIPRAADSGCAIALTSDLAALRALGLDVHVFAYGRAEGAGMDIPYPTTSVPVLEGARWKRLVRSLGGCLPAAAERYYSAEAERELALTLERVRPHLVIVEEVTLAAWLPLIRTRSPGARVVLRSHVFMRDACASQSRQFAQWMAPVLWREASLWNRLESQAVHESDEVWAITPKEARRYSEVYRANATYLPVTIDAPELDDIPHHAGDPDEFFHVGTLDSIKGHGVESFLQDQWPELLAANPLAHLTLAGRMTRRTCLDARQVDYAGFRDHLSEYYARARFALSLQRVTGGIKLKSLMAMAAGRTLVATAIGVEGIAIEHGIHYWNLERLALSRSWSELWRDPARNLEMAMAGRDWVRSQHSPQAAGLVLEKLLVRVAA